MAYQSHVKRRSFNSASILLVGNSGVGKSSTINHLFNLGKESKIHFAKTHGSTSETRDTQEYLLSTDDPEYEVKDLTLGVVDSPGFNDTDGTAQDACNMYSIKRFFESENLNGLYPNLVLILIKANDNRLDGDNSNLAKSLRCINKMRLVDTKHPNVVAVVTFADSADLGKREQTWKKKFEQRKKMIQNIIFKNLLVNADVIPIENDFEECELEKYLDWTILPNKSVQPKNLFDACTKRLLENGDLLGHQIFASAFESGIGVNVNEGKSVQAKNAKKERLNNGEKDFQRFFEKTAKGGLDEPIINEAAEFIKDKDEELTSNEVEEVQGIANTLIGNGIHDPADTKYVNIRNLNEKCKNAHKKLRISFSN